MLKQRSTYLQLLLGLGLLLLAACTPENPVEPLPTRMSLAYVPTLTSTPTATVTPTPLPTDTPLPPTRTPSPTPLPGPVTATPDPFLGLTIEELARRNYGLGALEIVSTLEITPLFTRYLISYPSETLTIYGFMNIPHEGNNLPVALVLHGYMPTENYQVQTYTAHYADALADAGFIAIHPNFRNYPPSDDGPNLFRTGYAIDTLNLVTLVRRQGQESSGILQQADASRIYLMGHSMGGGVALRTLTVDFGIRAAVLYASMSGNEAWNYAAIYEWSQGQRGIIEQQASEEVMAAVSAGNYLDRIQAAVSIHHGYYDELVPRTWSDQLCTQLQALGKQVECFVYPTQPHTFFGTQDELFIERMIDFFERH